MEIRQKATLFAMLLHLFAVMPSLGNAGGGIQTLHQLQTFQQEQMESIRFRLYPSDDAGNITDWDNTYNFYAKRGDAEISMGGIKLGFYQMYTTGRNEGGIVTVKAENHILVAPGSTQVNVLLELNDNLPISIAVDPAAGNYTDGKEYEYVVSSSNNTFSTMSDKMLFQNGKLHAKLYVYGPDYEGDIAIGVTDNSGGQQNLYHSIFIQDIALGVTDEVELNPSDMKTETGSLSINIGFKSENSTDSETP